jgi:Protein of unknown function (DUF3617)
MKFWKRSTLFILCVAALFLAGPSTLLAQLSDLPLKPGLWETHVTTKAGATNNSVAGQSCFTAGTTLGDYLTASNKGSGAQCSISNKVQSAHAISYDTACSGAGAGSKGHIDFQMSGTESFSGTSHTTVTGSMQGKPINMVIDKAFSAKFLRSDCGDVKPLVTPRK